MTAIIRSTLAAVALVASLGACSGDDNPVSPSADASAPHLDGGVTLGSGSRATSSEDPTEYTTTAADSGSTAGRGGVTLGSGS
jgi:hypothetical protein